LIRTVLQHEQTRPTAVTPSIALLDDTLAGGGDMGALIRRTDWALTPLGPAHLWPQSLRTSLSIMLESRFAMVVAWGPDFRFFYNDPYRPVLGIKHPAALGKPGREIFPEVWDVVGPEFERVRRGESFGIDDWLLPLERNGYLENVWFTLSYSPIRDETGGVGGVLAVVVETTGRVQGERQLATLRELARHAGTARSAADACERATATLGENTTDVPFSIAYAIDADGHHARLISASHIEPGSSAAPLTIDLHDPQNAAEHWPICAAIRDREPVIVTDVARRFGTLTGGPIPEPAHTAVVMPLARPGATSPYGALVMGVSPRRALDDAYRGFYDLATEHTVAAIGNAITYEEERRRAEALAELDRAKTAFFSNVSHEFRTPLTLMIGPLEDLLGGERGRLPAAVRTDVSAAHRNALRLLKLVNSLLDFSRLEAGRAQASFEPVDLAALTEDLASVFRSAVERAGLRYDVVCDALPEPVYVDRAMWEKIVLNLLSNALKFTITGGISVRMRCDADHVTLEVRDTGVGIPVAEQANVFKRFHRVHGARARTHEGTGIGLALVHDLAALHGGDVRVESVPDEGSTFTVRIRRGTAHLPAAPNNATEPAVSTAIRADAFVEEALRWTATPAATSEDVSELARISPSEGLPTVGDPQGRVLVVDDNSDMRAYLVRLLSGRYDVRAAQDGTDALRQLERWRPDLVLSDVMMPRLDGIGLLQALRAHGDTREIPVVLLSARAGEESAVEGLAEGADDYVVKPFAARELLARVRTHIELARTRSAAYIRIQEANESKRQFLAAMSHELRTPLNAILGYADLLTFGVRGDLQDEQQTDMVRIQDAARYLLGLINDILNFTRVDAGQVDFAIARVSVATLVERVEDLVSQLAAEKSITLDLARPDTPLFVETDAERAQQVLLNLLTNAIKFTPSGGHVSLACEADETRTRIHVRDTGCGIPADALERVFQPFVQIGRQNDRSGRQGVGLGLAISRDLARKMRGDVTVTSTLGTGSDFVLTLPRA
jgi:signal transduction histidine kinase/PAS domain-containing protein